MAKPRMMFYDDGRHVLIYMYEPPMQKEEYLEAVDGLLGTPIEALVFCLGEGRTMLHDTKVGELWGHNVEKWPSLVWRRPHQIAKQLIEEGNDPLMIICERSQAEGLLIYPSLIVQGGSDERWKTHTSVRNSNFRYDNKHLEIRARGDLDPSILGIDGLDFKHEEVREERFALVEEVLTNYPIDGFELQLAALCFRPDEVEAGRTIMTEWVRRVYEAVKRSGADRELAIRIPASIETCLSFGLDPREWIRQGIVDVITGDAGHADHVNPEADFRPLVEAAKGSECRVNGAIQGVVNSDRFGNAPIEVLRAVASNYWAQGIDGLYLARGWFAAWPYEASFYEKLREIPHPTVMAPKDKYYHISTTTSGERVWPQPEEGMQLPATLEVNKPVQLDFTVNDDLPRWDRVGRVHEVVLRVRVMETTDLDRLSFKFNGRELPQSLLRKINEVPSRGSMRRYGVYAYWFVFTLDREHWPQQGENTVEVTLLERDPDLTPDVVVRDVELETKYLMGKHFRRGHMDPALGPFEPALREPW